MIVSVLLLPVLGLVVYLLVRGSHAGEHATPSGPTPSTQPSTTTAPSGVVAELDRWRSAGLLTDEQAAAILDHERAHHPLPAPELVTAGPPAAGRRQLPDVTEALGYLGGVLAIVGMSLLVGRYWSDIPVAGRLGLSGGLAAALFGVGLLVPEDREPALRRMRWFLWLISSAASAVFGGVLAWELVGDDDLRVPLAAAGAVVLHDAFLWWRRERPLQQATFLIASAVALGTGVAFVANSGAAGLAVWALGVVGVVVGLRHLTRLPLLTLFAGAVTAVIGAMVVSGSWQAVALLLLVSTAATLVGLAAVRRLPTDLAEQRLLAIVGGVALFNGVPGTIGYFAEQAALTTGLVVWAIGAALVYLGGRDWLRLPVLVSVLGAIALIGGAALVAIDLERVGPLFGIATALALIALGVALDRYALTIVGSVGLLVHVPWAIVAWFPGEGRAPLLIMVSGALILAIAALLTRTRDRFPRLGGGHGTPPRLV
jgi:hypothetical protein